MPKFVTVPAPVRIGTFVYPFAHALGYVLDRAPSFQRPATAVRSAARLLAAFDDAEPGHVVELRDDDWKALDDLTESAPEWGAWEQKTGDGQAVPLVVGARVFLAFSNAINEAKNDPPAPAQEAAE